MPFKPGPPFRFDTSTFASDRVALMLGVDLFVRCSADSGPLKLLSGSGNLGPEPQRKDPILVALGNWVSESAMFREEISLGRRLSFSLVSQKWMQCTRNQASKRELMKVQDILREAVRQTRAFGLLGFFSLAK